MADIIISEPLTIGYYCIAVLSTVGSLLVSFEIVSFGYKSVTSRLALYLHVTQVLEDLSSLPAYKELLLCKCEPLSQFPSIYSIFLYAFFGLQLY